MRENQAPFSLDSLRSVLVDPSPRPSLKHHLFWQGYRHQEMANSSSAHDYFAAYPNFDPDPHLPLLANFNRLAKAQGWGKKRRKEERPIYLLAQYAIHLGGISAGKLQVWQGLCRELRLDPIPTSITQCKKVRCGMKPCDNHVFDREVLCD